MLSFPCRWLYRISYSTRSLSTRSRTAFVRQASGSSNKKMAPFPKPNSDPPKHEMQYFPSMTTALPSESGEFRRVLWTGLYSQVVLMTIPVGGDIGDEVSNQPA